MRRKIESRKMPFSAFAMRAGVIGVCAYLVFTLITTQVEIVAKRQQLENLAQQVQAQTAQNTELQRTLDAGDEAAYIERVARDKLNYAKPDERVFVDMSGK